MARPELARGEELAETVRGGDVERRHVAIIQEHQLHRKHFARTNCWRRNWTLALHLKGVSRGLCGMTHRSALILALVAVSVLVRGGHFS